MRSTSEHDPQEVVKAAVRGMQALPAWVHRLGYYGLALLLVAAAAMLRWMLPGVLGSTRFLVFNLAWVGAAAFGGLGPGLLATVASWLCVELMFDFTPGQAIFDDPTALARLVILMAGGLTVSLIAERLRRGRIRERKQEQALRESEERLRRRAEEVETLMDLVPVGIWVANDPQCDQIIGNRAANSLYESHDDENVSANVSPVRRFFRDGQELKPEELPMQEAAARNIDIGDSEVDVLLPSGKWRNMWGSASPLHDAEGRVRGCIGAFVDITARKQAEQALRELNVTLESRVAQRTAELKRRARQLQKMALDISEAEDRERERLAEVLHDDLQQMLAGAKFHLGLMRNGVRDDPALQEIGDQIDRMLKDAIAKSRSLSHELSPAVMHHADFTEILRWLASEVQAKHGLIVDVRAHGQISLQSDALKAFLYKAAQELLFNVVKHARANEAGIRIRQFGRCICLSVSDRGRGFDPQELGQTAGFGLLSIRERIELLGGRMKIRSARGKGSTFFVVVPDGEVEPELTGRAQGEDADRLRVLLADDHEIVREGLASLLAEESDVEVIGGASNGREAVDLVGRLEPDVVIMDVSMPLMSGDEATRQIKLHRPNTRVLALSMSVDPDTAERMHAAGAEAYVLKTAPSEELLAAIRGKT